MASQSSTGAAKQFSATAGKVGEWEKDRVAFFKAMRQNDASAAEEIIGKYPNEWKSWTSDKGASPLAVAQQHNSLETFKVLLDSGANINETTKGNWTPIATAYKNGQKDFFDYLLERGADLDQKLVIKAGAGEYGLDYNTTLLHMAVAADDKNVLVRLLERGADPKNNAYILSFGILRLANWGSIVTPAEMATKKKNFLLNDIINRAGVLRADFLAAAAQPAPVPAPAAEAVEHGKIDVMNPLQIKKPGTP